MKTVDSSRDHQNKKYSTLLRLWESIMQVAIQTSIYAVSFTFCHSYEVAGRSGENLASSCNRRHGFFGLAFILYIVGGFLSIRIGLLHLPYSFLSLETDPLLNLLAAAVGLSVCVGTSALLFLINLNNQDNVSRDIVILCSFIGFGFGAGVLRITAPFLIDLVL